MTHENKKNKKITSYVIKFLCKCNRHQKSIYNKKKNIRIMPGATGKDRVQKYLVRLLLVISFTVENSEDINYDLQVPQLTTVNT